MNATGFEPVTVCLEGRCSIQLSYAPISGIFNSLLGIMNFFKKRKLSKEFSLKSGRQDSNLRPPGPKPGAMTGLRYAPNNFFFGVAESKGFEPLVQFPIRLFSKQVLSATQATLQCNIYKSFCSVIASANIK